MREGDRETSYLLVVRLSDTLLGDLAVEDELNSNTAGDTNGEGLSKRKRGQRQEAEGEHLRHKFKEKLQQASMDRPIDRKRKLHSEREKKKKRLKRTIAEGPSGFP